MVSVILSVTNNNILDRTRSSVTALTDENVFSLNGTEKTESSRIPHLGVNMRGFYTSMADSREGFNTPFPNNYYETSFKLLSQGGAIDHVRYRFYWESYEKDPVAFIKEIENVAQSADKYGIKVIYDNHQFHTSSWLNSARGTGFPIYLFNSTGIKENSGGAPKYSSAETWWSNWWNRSIKSENGTDGWQLQANFLKKIVSTVNKYRSTLGYEILSEPQVHNKDQWEKIGKYNTFMTDELRKLTDRAIIYSMNIPIDLKSTIEVTPENMAKMVPKHEENVVFKMSLYGIPTDNYQSDKIQLFLNASRMAGAPLYVGEWNNVKRVASINEEGKKIWSIHPNLSDISQEEADMIVKQFGKYGIWGMSYWEWSFIPSDTPNFNLIKIVKDKVKGEPIIQPTKYFEIIKNAYNNIFQRT
ncbi:MAG TPA: hypothetical protein VF220_03800 [Nitrososphaeraceae archaeon]